MLQEKEIQILMSLGLTSVQAKAYLTLIKLGNATVKTISKASSIVSQDTYRIMPQLQKRGLAEKIIAKPTRYQATPLNDGLHILLQKRAEEHAKLENETLWLLENFQEKDHTHFQNQLTTKTGCPENEKLLTLNCYVSCKVCWGSGQPN